MQWGWYHFRTESISVNGVFGYRGTSGFQNPLVFLLQDDKDVKMSQGIATLEARIAPKPPPLKRFRSSRCTDSKAAARFLRVLARSHEIPQDEITTCILLSVF